MFDDRKQAGEILSLKLSQIDFSDALVFAIPRGGVVIGFEIAKRLKVPLKILAVKKIGAPNNPELAIGAVAGQKTTFTDGELALRLGIDQKQIDALIKAKEEELAERLRLYQIKYPKTLSGKTIILTDDGVATGATVKAAIKYLRLKKAKKIILAIPVVAKDSYDEIKSLVDRLIAVEIPDSFGAVGQFYREFPQVTDEEVISMMKRY